MTDTPEETKTPETETPKTETAEPAARRAAGRRKTFDPSDPTSMEVAMYDTAFAVRFLSQSFLGRTDMESVDSAGFEGLGIILECIADRIEAMEAVYAAMTGARKSGGG